MLSGYFGRKKVNIGGNLISVFGFLFLRFATSVWLLYIGRILGGYSFGILFTNTPLYNGEISQSKLRKFSGSLMPTFYNAGFVSTFGLTTVLSWRTTILIMLGFPILNIILLVICPESPTWLMLSGKYEIAISTLTSLRGNEEVAMKEIKRIEQNIKKQRDSTKTDDDSSPLVVKIKIMRKGTFIRPFIVVVILLTIGWHWTGGPIIGFYTIDIIKSVKIPMDPYICAFIIASFQFVMSIVSTVLSSIIPRRKLFMACGMFETIGNLILGTMVYLNRNDYLISISKEYPFVNWIPLVGILLYYGGYFAGYVTVIFTLLAELLPSNARNVGSSLATTGSISSLFILIKFGPTLQETIGLDGCFWLFSVVTFCSIIFCYFFVPETFGKSLESIEDHYRAICYGNTKDPEKTIETFPDGIYNLSNTCEIKS